MPWHVNHGGGTAHAEGLAQLVPSNKNDPILARAKVDLVGCEPAPWLLLTRTNSPVATKLKMLSFVRAHDSEQEAAQVLAGWQSKRGQRRRRAQGHAHAAQPALFVLWARGTVNALTSRQGRDRAF